MGYYSRMTGEVTFAPPLTWEEQGRLPEKFLRGYDSLFHFETDPDGEVPSDTIVPCTDDSVKAYELRGDLERILRLLPGRTFSGEFRIEGEEAGDIQRVFVRNPDACVVEWKAELAWPDGTTERAR